MLVLGGVKVAVWLSWGHLETPVPGDAGRRGRERGCGNQRDRLMVENSDRVPCSPSLNLAHVFSGMRETNFLVPSTFQDYIPRGMPGTFWFPHWAHDSPLYKGAGLAPIIVGAHSRRRKGTCRR